MTDSVGERVKNLLRTVFPSWKGLFWQIVVNAPPIQLIFLTFASDQRQIHEVF